MGGKASKVLKETTLVTCNTHGDGSKFPVICGSPVSDRIKGIEGGELLTCAFCSSTQLEAALASTASSDTTAGTSTFFFY